MVDCRAVAQLENSMGSVGEARDSASFSINGILDTSIECSKS